MSINSSKKSLMHDSASAKKYQPSSIELKWQSKWDTEGVYQPSLDTAKANEPQKTKELEANKKQSKKLETSADLASKSIVPGTPFYNLMMFPYPSAEGLHVGSMYAFGGADVFARFKRMQGYSVFEPMGLDGFGIHSENHAIKTGTHPVDHAKRTQINFYRQLHAIGNSYAWDNKLETYDPQYYNWTQWMFVQLFKSGLAYRKKSPVNYCPSCKTVLSDEQVIDGQCERCNSVVEKRDLEQWYFRITDYAEPLLNNINKLQWSDKVKVAQKNWIGKKEGINISYPVEGRNEKITVFTTRPDTNFGATFIALAPEHPLALQISTVKQKKAVEAYINESLHKSEIERAAEGKEKTGVFTGAYAVNPLTQFKMPIWISDFVLGGFGTGALVGVPAHDKRDFAFAQKYDLEIIRVVVGNDGDQSAVTKLSQVQEDAGKMINSGFLNGMNIHDATHTIMDYIEKEGYGKREVTYHLRDWLISRQRYWGPPIPMLYCEHCAANGKSWFTSQEAKDKKMGKPALQEQMAGWYPEEQLPVVLPYLKDFKPLGTGKSPLAQDPAFYKTVCPSCGHEAVRETDVSDTFLDSSWYFLRYLTTDLQTIPFPMPEAKAKEFKNADPSEMKKAAARSAWLPVTMYIGGAEHSVLHLLYARFVTMALKDMGYLSFDEPFTRFYAHGLIIKDGAKMSKSKGNIINPDEYIAKYGADTLRTYLLFLGPFNMGGDFRDSGIDGMHRFLKRIWNLLSTWQKGKDNELNPEALRMLHETVKGVSEDLEDLRYNTAIAKMMTYYNFLVKQPELHREEVRAYVQMLAPFAPHMMEELWHLLGLTNAGEHWSVHRSLWPTFDTKHLVMDTLTVAIQVNGKLRGTLEIAASEKENRELIEKLGREQTEVAKFLTNGVRKVIYVPGKILNFVI